MAGFEQCVAGRRMGAVKVCACAQGLRMRMMNGGGQQGECMGGLSFRASSLTPSALLLRIYCLHLRPGAVAVFLPAMLAGIDTWLV